MQIYKRNTQEDCENYHFCKQNARFEVRHDGEVLYLCSKCLDRLQVEVHKKAK
jgi:ribosomal protein L24E